jgi:hypothetical protein
MKPLLFIISFGFFCSFSFGQPSPGKFIEDKRIGCQVWVSQGYSPTDSLSISWTGGCKNKMADGFGTLTWYIRKKEVSRYVGFMQAGNPSGQGRYKFVNGTIAEGNFENGLLNGQGKLIFGDERKLEGNFVNGQILNLDKAYLQQLQKIVVSNNDSTDMYVNDGNSKELFYYVLLPHGSIKGVLILLAGTWDTAEYVLSNNKKLVQLAFEDDIAIITPSINQRLTLNFEVADFLNNVFKDAISRFHLPKEKFVLGGFSMGGLFSLRYTEMAHENNSQTAIVPIAVYSVDGPTDLANTYTEFLKATERNPNAVEPKYGINELSRFIGAPPEKFHEKYVYYSSFSKSEANSGNARFLKNVPVRIYNDVDVAWWLTNRGADLYDMNALDQSAMINFLRKQGNKNAEFINAYGKGYRLEGNRHPHSWSIVDAVDCLNWIKRCIQ